MNNNKSNSKTASKIKKLAMFLEKNLLLEEKKILLLNLLIIIIINLLVYPHIPILMIILN